MKKIWKASWTAAILAGMYFGVAAEGAIISTTFDTNAEGWTGTPGEGQLDYVSSGGNPGGYIQITDIGAGGAPLGSGAVAPAQFLGDLSVFSGGMLTFDMATFGGGGSTFGSFGLVRITGGGGLEAFFDVAGAAPPFGVWQSYAAPLTAADWGVSAANWTLILGSVSEIAFSTDAFDGLDVIGVDNFAVSSSQGQVPEPTAVVLLGVGLLMAFRLRRRHNR